MGDVGGIVVGLVAQVFKRILPLILPQENPAEWVG